MKVGLLFGVFYQYFVDALVSFLQLLNLLLQIVRKTGFFKIEGTRVECQTLWQGLLRIFLTQFELVGVVGEMGSFSSCERVLLEEALGR